MRATTIFATSAFAGPQTRMLGSNDLRPAPKCFLARPLRLRPSPPTRSVVLCSYGRDPRFRQGDPFRGQGQKRSPRRPPTSENVKIVIREYGIPALGVFAAATLLGPLIGAVVFSSIAAAVAVAAVVAAFSLSWLLVPILLGFMGIPLLFGGGLISSMFAGAAGVLLFPAFLQIGLIAAAVWVGTSIAREMFFAPEVDSDEGYSGNVDARNAVVDVDAKTIDDLEQEMEEERRRREQELRDFDDLLKRRERFQRGEKY